MSVHFFDVDYTLIRKSTAYYFLLEGLRQGVFTFRQFRQLPFEWFRYKIGLANHDFIEQAVKHLVGIDRRLVEDLSASCFTRSLKPNIYAEGNRLIRNLLDHGEEVHLATSSFYNLIQPLETFFSISGSIASALDFEDDKTSGRINGSAQFGVNKKTAVEAWLRERSLSREDIWFYSDSYTDLPLLEFSGHPVAVNPDRFLRRTAKKRGWAVLEWREVLGSA
jgi:HAD superfamily hydrolase (TIGR01490 family)